MNSHNPEIEAGVALTVTHALGEFLSEQSEGRERPAKKRDSKTRARGMSEPSTKKSKAVSLEVADREAARLHEVVQRAANGQDVSPLLISITGHKVDPSTPTVGRRLPPATPPPALHLACHCGDLAAVKALLAAPAQRASVGTAGGPRSWLPIVYATFMGHLAIVKLLVEAGSPLPGEKLLCRAIGGGQAHMLSWLLGPGGLDMNDHPRALRKVREERKGAVGRVTDSRGRR